ncbi:MAG: alpha-galactosidase, partial [Muribaculaceae bacterium]|nr:alpha-galactosidase [Muribaculaceae bacterium]
GKSGQNDLEQNIYIYENLPYILVEASVIASSGTTSSTKICPIVSETTTTLSVLGSSNNRVYNMPFANDNWATFNTVTWEVGQQVISCEATALFNNDSRKAIVLGSVDHSTWKSAVYVTPNGSNRLRKLTAEAGYISERTWDIVKDKASSERHGAVKGAKVSSPRFMLGVFDDWRTGMETYADANAVLCPKYVWDKDESLFGWQSWGGMEFGLNYTSAMSVLDFFERELKPVGFFNKQGRCHLVLDSGWSALSDEQLRKYADRCKELGFVAGIYTTPFTYWGGEDAVLNNNEWEGGRLGEMVLKTGGKYRHINGWSLDPTHPAVKEWNRRTLQKFRDLGFEFVKIDFMNNGSQEADSWYDPNITTGMMAYNYGMDYIKEFCGDNMIIDFSIAPIFPNKAHVRRIGCDAWGELNNSMYTLNCIQGSWWLDRLYTFNDPDHMCMSKVKFSNKGSNDEQEARIRYTCGLITG